VDKLPKNQKDYYHNKIRQFEKRTGNSMNVKGVSKIYDCNIEYCEYNTLAAMDMMQKHGCYIYHDLLAEEDFRSNGSNWQMYGFAHVNGKTYKYYYETKQWGVEVKDFTHYQHNSKTWKAAKLDKTNFPYTLDPGEDYLPYAIEPVSIDSSRNKHIGSDFDSFLKTNNIVLKRDMNWAIKMVAQGKIVYREEFPEVILFPIGSKNNPETKLNVDDLFAEDWTIFRGKSLKEVLDDLDAGKSIRRKSWYPEYLMGKYSKDFELNLQDLKARDWEVVDIVAEVDKNQQDIEDGKY
jgi:hypothetical protein